MDGPGPAPVPDGLPGRRVAVTGAGGFLGLAASERLTAAGAQVVGLELDTGARERVEAAGAAFRAVDTTDPVGVRAALTGCDGVIHTAAVVAERGAMADFVAVNVGGTRTVLDAAAAVGARRVVHVSSVAVWGYDFARDVTEDAPRRAVGAPYVDTKAASERLALRRGAAVVRPGDVYGPRSVPWTIRPVQAMQAGVFALPGRGDGVMTPVYVDDLVDCLLRALVHPDAGGVAVTAHDGHPVPAREFFAPYARLLGHPRVRTLPAAAVRAGAWALEARARATGSVPLVAPGALTYVTRRAAYPNQRARTLLGWEPQVALAEGMRRTTDWLRASGLLR